MTQEELTIWAAKIIGNGKNDSGEIEFVKTDTDETKTNIIALYEAISGRSLARADPVRLFLEVITYVIILLKTTINYTGKMNLLRHSSSEYLDEIGLLVGTKRLTASAATTTLLIKLSVQREQGTLIPKGTRATADSKVFFAVEKDIVIPQGQTQIQVGAVCTETGTVGNDYAPGEISKIVDPIPFVDSIVNTTITEGGADVEADESYRERIRQAPESFSSAGPDGAYRYHAMSASVLIVDVSVITPQPAEVEIRPLLAGGEIPGEEILNTVKEVLNDRKIRPLTDKLSVLPPEIKPYNITLSYWISKENAPQAAAIQIAIGKAVEEYVLWQKSKLGRDINQSELIYRIRAAGAKRIDITAPIFEVVTASQVAIAQNIEVLFGGFEDE